MGRVFRRWKAWAEWVRLEALLLYLACRDSRTPRSAKMLALGVVGYALSPLDLIPDPLPFLGYLDDVAILLLGLAFLPRMIPSAILADCRTQARAFPATQVRWVAAGLMIANWLIAATVIGYFSYKAVG